MTKISLHMQRRLTEWVKYAKMVEAPTDPEEHRLWRRVREYGLCSWCNADEELIDLFTEAGLDHKFPFGRRNYYKCQSDDIMHLDPARLAFVHAMLADEPFVSESAMWSDVYSGRK